MKTILIIDDSNEFRIIFRDMLRKAGYQVLEASSGQEGIDIYRRTPADLVVTDIIMPGKEGLETILDLKREFPGVKIIAVSGGGFEGPSTYLEGATLIGGVDRTFFKPFAMDPMLKAIKELLEK
jgi:CheY-like chemotaxis protein